MRNTFALPRLYFFGSLVLVAASLTAQLHAQGQGRQPAISAPSGGSILPSLKSLFRATSSAEGSGSGTARARIRKTGKPVLTLQDKLRTKGDLTLSGTSLRDAILTISDSWKINVVVGDEVEGTVNGSFRNAPLHEILHAILYANGFGYRAVGESLSVTKLDNLGDVNPLFTSATIRLQAAKPEDVANGAKHLISPQGKLVTLKSARSVLVTDLPERVTRVKEFAQGLDVIAAQVLARSITEDSVAPQPMQFRLQFVKVATITEAVQTVLSKAGKATAIAKENRLVVIDLPSNLKSVAKLIKELDQPRPQVRITAMIYDAGLEDIERIGINWNHALKDRIDGMGTAQSRWTLDSILQAPTAAGSAGGVMTFMNLSRHFDITATIQMLNQSNNSRLLADPNVLVEDQETATIQIVTEIPFQQLTQTSAGGDIGTTSFREAGVTLNVSPQISSDGTIRLLVTPTFSRLVGFTTSSNPQPIIDKREANTTVRVANKQTLVIGGLRQRTDINNYAGIPFLKDIKPLNIGKLLFSSVNKTVRESELLVFLRPEIVTPMYGGRFREQRAAMDAVELLDRMPLYPRIAPRGPQPGCEDEAAQGSVSDGYFYEAPQEKSHSYETPTINIPPVRMESETPSNSANSVTLQPMRQQQRQSQQRTNVLVNNRLRTNRLQNAGLRNDRSRNDRSRNNRLRNSENVRRSDNVNMVRLPSTNDYNYAGQGKVVSRSNPNLQSRQNVRRTKPTTPTTRKRTRRISHAGMDSTRQPRRRTSRSRRDSPPSASSSQRKRSWWSEMFK